jgi:hypothetical protein
LIFSNLLVYHLLNYTKVDENTTSRHSHSGSSFQYQYYVLKIDESTATQSLLSHSIIFE